MTDTEVELDALESKIGYTFQDKSYAEIALTHASSSDDRLQSNERYEFLGDSILGYVISEYLFQTYPDYEEGELTKIKSSVVSRKTCAKVSNVLVLGPYLRLGKGMAQQKAIPESIEAGLIEALIAAVYLDGGFTPAREFILSSFSEFIRNDFGSSHQGNFKSVLQQHVQKLNQSQPNYKVLDEKGPDHAKCFEICVVIEDRSFASAWAKSKKEAEQKAALNALISLDLAEKKENGEVRLISES